LASQNVWCGLFSWTWFDLSEASSSLVLFHSQGIKLCPKISQPREYANITNEQETWLVSGSYRLGPYLSQSCCCHVCLGSEQPNLSKIMDFFSCAQGSPVCDCLGCSSVQCIGSLAMVHSLWATPGIDMMTSLTTCATLCMMLLHLTHVYVPTFKLPSIWGNFLQRFVHSFCHTVVYVWDAVQCWFEDTVVVLVLEDKLRKGSVR
jgi:hypothetical protein